MVKLDHLALAVRDTAPRMDPDGRLIGLWDAR